MNSFWVFIEMIHPGSWEHGVMETSPRENTESMLPNARSSLNTNEPSSVGAGRPLLMRISLYAARYHGSGFISRYMFHSCVITESAKARQVLLHG